MAACRTITEDAPRLACFDKAVAQLEAAAKSGDLVVMDREQIHEAKKQVFGLPNVEALNIFSGGAHPEAVERITGEIAQASQDAQGHWVLVTKDGQVWTQTDVENFYPEPSPGDRVVIRRGMLGAFFVTINNNASFKARRDK